MEFEYKEYSFKQIEGRFIDIFYHDTLLDCWGNDKPFENHEEFKNLCFKYLVNEEGEGYIV